jgi:hypothetical protein
MKLRLKVHTTTNALSSTRKLWAIVLLPALVMIGCFKDPITGPVDGKPVNPKPAVVSQDSTSASMVLLDDVGSEYMPMVFSNRAPYLGITDSSSFVVDTTGTVPKLSMNVSFSPLVKDPFDARELNVRSIQIRLDSLPVHGEGWQWLHKGETVFTILTAEKPSYKYTRIPISSAKPPSSPVESFARVMAWKATNRREIVLMLDMQCITQVYRQGGIGRGRFAVGGAEIHIPY